MLLRNKQVLVFIAAILEWNTLLWALVKTKLSRNRFVIFFVALFSGNRLAICWAFYFFFSSVSADF